MQNNQNNDNAVSDCQDLANLMVEHFEKVYAKLDEKADKSDLALKADKSDIDRVLSRISLIGQQN